MQKKMNKTNRLYLVPEELYQQMMQTPGDGSVLGHIRANMEQIVQKPGEPADEKAVRYEQEFKRYNKIVREEEERPLNVQLKNVKEIADAIPKPTEKKVVVGLKRAKVAIQKKRKKQQPKSESDEEEAEVAPSGSIANFIRKHAQAMGINDRGQVLKTVGGVDPLKTSNVNTIIDHFRRNRGVARAPLPPGYNLFVQRMDSQFPALRQLLESGSNRSQSGSGKKIYKKTSSFAFKPKLWS